MFSMNHLKVFWSTPHCGFGTPTRGTARLSAKAATIQKDNHEVEAFLKPVSRNDVPDYHDGECDQLHHSFIGHS